MYYEQAFTKFSIRSEETSLKHLTKRSPLGQMQNDSGTKLDSHRRSIPLTARHPIARPGGSQVFGVDPINNLAWSLKSKCGL